MAVDVCSCAVPSLDDDMHASRFRLKLAYMETEHGSRGQKKKMCAVGVVVGGVVTGIHASYGGFVHLPAFIYR